MNDADTQDRIKGYVRNKYITFIVLTVWSIFLTAGFFFLYKLTFVSGVEAGMLFIGSVGVPIIIYSIIFDKGFRLSSGSNTVHIGKKTYQRRR